MSNDKDLRSLHGKDYVERFESNQSPFRLDRLISLICLSQDMVVCDFGCGNGMLMGHVCPKVAEYVGVDFSAEFIEAANERKRRLGISNASFYHDDIDRFCAKRQGNFDAAFAMDFSEHVYDDEWVKILSNIRFSLKSDGALILHTPNARFLFEIMKERNIILKQFSEHVAVRNAEHNERLLREAGFRSISTCRLPHYNILKVLHPLSYIPVIGRYFEARLFIQAVA